jgi:15-cis-phytoene synthase
MIALAEPTSSEHSNLAFALRCLPRSRRAPALVFYRFCRAVDDIADDPSAGESEKRAGLGAWRHAIESDRGLPEELRVVIGRFGIDRGLLLEIVRGCEMDVVPQVFQTIEDLRVYCWRVACAVGLVSIRIFGCTHPDSACYAEHLGYALQFTNILRDIGEDAAMGRIYLPASLLEKHGVNRQKLLDRTNQPGLGPAIKEFAATAREAFHAANSAFPPQDAKPLLPARIMAAVYSRLLGIIESPRTNPLEHPPRLSTPSKALAFASVWLETHLTRMARND